MTQLEDTTLGVTLGPNGQVYVLQQGCEELFTNSGQRYIPAAIYRFNSNGTWTLIAGGQRRCGSGGDGGLAVRANFDEPLGIAADSAGNLYVSDQNGERIRKVTTDGKIYTVAGSGPAWAGSYRGDGGAATGARLNRPCGVALDAAANIYFTQLENSSVRKVTAATGIISTIGGNGRDGYRGDGGPGNAAQLHFPCDIAVDANGSVYVWDEDNYRVRKIDPKGIITTVAGNGQEGDPFSGIQSGAKATDISLTHSGGLAVAPDGTLFIGDQSYGLLRLGKDGKIYQVSGQGWEPRALAFDQPGNLYMISDGMTKTLYKLSW